MGQYPDVYRVQKLPSATRDELANELQEQLVQVVHEQPPEVLGGVPLDQALHINRVDLHDGVQLAVVVDPVVVPMEERNVSILRGPEVKVEVSAGVLELEHSS
jgi:hypothetical protein